MSAAGKTLLVTGGSRGIGAATAVEASYSTGAILDVTGGL